MKILPLSLFLVLFATALAAQTFGPGGVMVSLERHTGPAKVSAATLDKFKLRVDIDRNGDPQPLNVRVELPNSGPHAWPITDVEVRDADGVAMAALRSGIEWENLLVPITEQVSSFFVQSVEPAVPAPPKTAEKARVLIDDASGAQVRVAKWPRGRAAALSIRFDDSHPTHLSKAIPILREYGFKGTFMVNPGPKEPGSRQNYAFETQHAEWEAVMKQGDMELANHSAHHRGARGDEDMEREIGGAAEAIWKLTPGKSKLMALNLGGGTLWETTRPLRHYLDKYHQFDASSGSLGMDDSYGGRVEAFRKALETHLVRGLWCKIHYHYIGDGLSSSEANFRAALDVAKQHRDQLWIAGMADIHKYQTERDCSTISRIKSDANSLSFQLDCPTNAALYDQPLTLELRLPEAWDASNTTIRTDDGTIIPAEADGAALVRFEAMPRRANYTIAAMPSTR